MSFDHEPYWHGRQGNYGSTDWNTVQWGEWSTGQMHRQTDMAAAAQRSLASAQQAESARRNRLQAASILPVAPPHVINPVSPAQNPSPGWNTGRTAPRLRP